MRLTGLFGAISGPSRTYSINGVGHIGIKPWLPHQPDLTEYQSPPRIPPFHLITRHVLDREIYYPAMSSRVPLLER